MTQRRLITKKCSIILESGMPGPHKRCSGSCLRDQNWQNSPKIRDTSSGRFFIWAPCFASSLKKNDSLPWCCYCGEIFYLSHRASGGPGSNCHNLRKFKMRISRKPLWLRTPNLWWVVYSSLAISWAKKSKFFHARFSTSGHPLSKSLLSWQPSVICTYVGGFLPSRRHEESSLP